MGIGEVRARAQQEIGKYTDWLHYRAGLAFHQEPTRSAPPGRFFFDSPDVPPLLNTLRERLPGESAAIVQRAQLISAHRFSLLGYTDLAYGPAIDWHFDPVHHKGSPREPWFRVDYFDPGEVGDPNSISWSLPRRSV